MDFEIIETPRLQLKKYTPEHFRYVFANLTEDEIKRELGIYTDEDFLKEKEKNIGGFTTYDRTIAHFKLIVKETRQVIGGGGFHNWYSQHRKAELGYALTVEEMKNKGYMSEAVTAMLHYGFHHMNLNRVEACVGPTNVPSLSLVKKFGFMQEGYLRQHYIRDNEIQDSLIFSLLREEYFKEK